jgi:hypothetical protein
VKLLSIAAAFLITTSIARAGLHGTLQECEKQYGRPITGGWTDEWGRAVFAVNRRGDSNYTYLLESSGIWSKPPGVEFYKRRAAIAAMAFRYAKYHPGNDYRIAAIIGVGVNDAYPTITVTALDIATYIQKRDPSIPIAPQEHDPILPASPLSNNRLFSTTACQSLANPDSVRFRNAPSGENLSIRRHYCGTQAKPRNVLIQRANGTKYKTA